MHGGQAAQVKARAAERVLEQQAAEVLAREGVNVEPIRDPLTALQRLAGERKAELDHFARLAGRLGDDGLRYEHARTGEETRAEVVLWERASDRYERVLKLNAVLRVDERLAAIGERQAAVIGGVFSDAIARLPIPPDVVAEATEYVMTEVARRSEQLDRVLVGNVVRSGRGLPVA